MTWLKVNTTSCVLKQLRPAYVLEIAYLDKNKKALPCAEAGPATGGWGWVTRLLAAGPGGS